MHTRKLPFVTLLITLTLIVSFFVNVQQDAKKWNAIQEAYQSKLQKLEVPIYLDYLERKLTVENLGSSEHILSIKHSFDKGENLMAIKAILSDRAFTDYIRTKGHSFLSDETLTLWETERDLLNTLYKSTSAQRLGLSPFNFEIRQVLTHLLSHPYQPIFILFLISFVLVLFCFEKSLGAYRLCYYSLISALASTFAYLLLAPRHAQLMEGGLSLTYGLASSLLVYHLHKNNLDKQSMTESKWRISLSVLAILSLIFYTSSTAIAHANPLPYLLASTLFPAIGAGLFMVFSLKVADSERPQNKLTTDNTLDWEYRAELAKALDFVSRFEFNSARQVLNSLGKRYPESPVILEQRYNLAKLQPEDSLYWKLAQKLVEQCVHTHDYERICRLFRDIQTSAANKKQAQKNLSPEYYHQIMTLFINQGDLLRAEQAFHFLELGGDKHIIQDACRVLIKEFKIRDTSVKQEQYEMLLERLKA